MQPTRPFLLTLAFVTAGGALILGSPNAPAAHAQNAMPLSTHLTAEMIDYFGLADAYVKPSISALVACEAAPACGATDSVQVRFLDARGNIVPDYDGTTTATIEQIRHQHSAPAAGVTETRTLVRRYARDDAGRVLVNGTDSIVRIDAGAPGREPGTLVRVHRYTDLKYLLTDPRFVFPMTGLVVLDLSNVTGAGVQSPAHTATHAAVSFDGTHYAHVLTSSALTHRVNLQSKTLETTIPDR